MNADSKSGEWLEPTMTPQIASILLGLKASDALIARLDMLGDKANEGHLTPEERQEYKAYIDANDVLAILQAKARRVLRTKKA